MLLAIDIGNSHIAIGLNTEELWVEHWRISTDPRRTADEYTSQLYSMMVQKHIDPQRIDGVVISSVVPELITIFKQVSESLCDLKPFLIHRDIESGLIKESIPAELGADLLSNAAAAHELYPDKTCMVIDFGTALTFTTVDAKGSLLGVAIAPGIGSAVGALSNKTAQLPHVEISIPKSVLGLNTVEAIQSGVMFGYIGLITEMIARTEKELDRSIHIIATGGFSKVLSPSIDTIDEIRPWHTLDGLNLLYQMNS